MRSDSGMGNKLCKKKVDTVDNPKPQTPFDRIITRLHVSTCVVVYVLGRPQPMMSLGKSDFTCAVSNELKLVYEVK